MDAAASSERRDAAAAKVNAVWDLLGRHETGERDRRAPVVRDPPNPLFWKVRSIVRQTSPLQLDKGLFDFRV